MARNIMHDHRVTPEREHEFARVAGVPSDGAALANAIDDYYKEHVRDAKSPPPFVDEAQNGPNILTHSPPHPNELHPDCELGRIVRLDPLDDVFASAHRTDPHKFNALGRALNETVLDWLDNILVTPQAIESFVRIALEAINSHLSRNGPYQPSWCAPWEALEPYLAEGPDRWAEAVGLPNHHGQACWLIVLKYKCRDAGTVCRPCQLDAGWFDHHFPSPPQARQIVGGHTMDCRPRVGPGVGGLISEYIHPQIPHPFRHWVDAGSRCKKRSAEKTADIDTLRKIHHERLAHCYGRHEICLWMPNPT